VPFGLNRDDNPITYDVVRGTEGESNPQESLENVVVDPSTGVPGYSQNPVRNMRMILPRSRPIERKGPRTCFPPLQINLQGEEILDLRKEWLPINIYGDADYTSRVVDLRCYYGVSSEDKAGILRYTKATDAPIGLGDVPPPSNERELAWLLSFHWQVNNA
jgi:hypothetical protein